jgi:hypothetical protein
VGALAPLGLKRVNRGELVKRIEDHKPIEELFR